MILAAGSSTRMGLSVNKPYADIGGRQLLWYSLSAFERAGVPDPVVVVRSGDETLLSGTPAMVEGGATRTASEMAGLAVLEDRQLDVIMIHDGARPFLRPVLVARLARVAAEVGGAVPGLEPDERLWKRRNGDLTPLTEHVVRVQTPQAFQASGLRDAYRAARLTGATGADTAEIVQRFGALEVKVVPGDPALFKITYADDLERAAAEAASWWQDVTDDRDLDPS